MNLIKRNVCYVAAMDGTEVEFDEDEVKALLPSEFSLKYYNLDLTRKSPNVLLVFLSATNVVGNEHIFVKTLDQKHFHICQGFEISEVWSKALGISGDFAKVEEEK